VGLLLNVPAAAKPTVVATAATPPTMAIMALVDSPAAPGTLAPEAAQFAAALNSRDCNYRKHSIY
jgi:hypothetical protein